MSPEPMHDNGTQTIKAEVVEPIVEAPETCREEANTSSSYSPSPRTVYTCNDGKVGLHCVTLLTAPALPKSFWQTTVSYHVCLLANFLHFFPQILTFAL